MTIDIEKLRARLAQQGMQCLHIPIMGVAAAVHQWGLLRFASIADLNAWIETGEVPRRSEFKSKDEV